MSDILVIVAAVALALGVTAVAVGRWAARGRRPWLPLLLVWLGLASPFYVARPELTLPSVGSALMLLAPLGVTALATSLEVGRGCSLRRAGSVAVILGLLVAAAAPFLISSSMRLLCAASECP